MAARFRELLNGTAVGNQHRPVIHKLDEAITQGLLEYERFHLFYHNISHHHLLNYFIFS